MDNLTDPEVKGITLPANARFAITAEEIPASVVWEGCEPETHPITGETIPGTWERSTHVIVGSRYFRWTSGTATTYSYRYEAS